MSAAREVTATFAAEAPSEFPLTLKKTGTGKGTVTSSPAGIGCGPACAEESASFPVEAITLSASPQSGSEFGGWGLGECESEPELGQKCVVTTNSAKTVHAAFAPIPRTLAIVEAGAGTGTVECKFDGGSAGPCTSPQPNGTGVEAIATADPGSSFAGFSSGTGSAAACSASPCAFTIEADSSITATFTPISHTLTVEVEGPGVVTGPEDISCPPLCGGTFPEGETVTLTATPGAKAHLVEWTGPGAGPCAGSSAPTCEVQMSADKTVKAIFAADTAQQPLALKIEKGEGTVASSPAGLECQGPAPQSCEAEFEQNATVTLTASPAAGYALSAWGGCTEHLGLTCKVTMDKAKTVKASFARTWELAVEKAGTGYGKVTATGINCDESCSTATSAIKAGMAVTVKATPAKGSEAAVFESGTGSAGSCSASPCTFTIEADSSLKVRFSPIPRKAITVKLTGPAAYKGKVKGKAFVKGLTLAAIGCSSGCTSATESFLATDEIEMTATAALGYTFKGWNVEGGSAGTCTAATTPCKLPTDADKTVKAQFE
jgi:hypothetical protein